MHEIAKRKEFGDWIREKRYQVDLSLWDASMKLGYKSRGTLANMECGRGALPLERIFDLAELYKIDLDDILDKLGECEPELHGKFMALRARFLRHLTRDLTHSLEISAGGRKMIGLHKQNYQDTGGYRRKGFLNEDGYLEVDRTIYYQTLIDLIEKALQEPPPDIVFPGITNFDRSGPQIVIERGFLNMMGIKDMKEYCIKEIKTMGAYNPLLDIFYLIIQDKGKSYIQMRSTWIKTGIQQRELFKET